MINAKKMKKYFDKKYSDKNTAKMIIGEIKTHIEYGVVDPTFVGKWYEGLSDGTIKILIDKGYIIKRSVEHCDEFAVLFIDADVGIPYEKSVSFGGKLNECDKNLVSRRTE